MVLRIFTRDFQKIDDFFLLNIALFALFYVYYFLLGAGEEYHFCNQPTQVKHIDKLENRICRQIQDLHASFGIKERRSFAKLYIPVTLFLHPGVKNKLIFTLWAAVSEILAVFQNCHIWARSFSIGKYSRSCTYTLFLPRGVEIKLIFALRVAVFKIQANFQNFHIWA